jgi:hypothetical protein
MKSIEGITLDWVYARVVEQDGCLIWNCACGGGDKLPQARIGGVAMVMRRVMWELANEKAVPDGRRVSPSCGNSKCIHPDHMRALPINLVFKGVKKTAVHRANIARARRAKSAWSDEDIRAVAASVGPLDAVAQQYGMDRSYVSQIRLNKARVDFTNPYLQLLGAR